MTHTARHATAPGRCEIGSRNRYTAGSKLWQAGTGSSCLWVRYASVADYPGGRYRCRIEPIDFDVDGLDAKIDGECDKRQRRRQHVAHWRPLAPRRRSLVFGVAVSLVVAANAPPVGAQPPATRDPKAVAQYEHGTASAARGDHGAAIKALEEAVRLEPQWLEPRNDLGVELYLNSEPQRAVNELRAALALDRGRGTVLANLGFALYDLGEVDEAVRQWRAALDKGAAVADTYAGLALGLYKQGKTEEALQAYRMAVDRQEDYARSEYLSSGGAGWSRHAITDVAPLLRALNAPTASPGAGGSDRG